MNDAANDWFGPDSATFGDRLAGARENAGMTQLQLSERLGVKQSTLRSWEDDIAEPRANRLSMLAGLLNVSMGWLINGTGDGVDAPDGSESPSDTMRTLMIEIRAARAQMLQSAEHLARIEKKLRVSLAHSAE